MRTFRPRHAPTFSGCLSVPCSPPSAVPPALRPVTGQSSRDPHHFGSEGDAYAGTRRASTGPCSPLQPTEVHCSPPEPTRSCSSGASARWRTSTNLDGTITHQPSSIIHLSSVQSSVCSSVQRLCPSRPISPTPPCCYCCELRSRSSRPHAPGPGPLILCVCTCMLRRGVVDVRPCWCASAKMAALLPKP